MTQSRPSSRRAPMRGSCSSRWVPAVTPRSGRSRSCSTHELRPSFVARVAMGIGTGLPLAPWRTPSGQRLARRHRRAGERCAVRRGRRRSGGGRAGWRSYGAASKPHPARSCSTTPTTRVPASMAAALQALASVRADGRRIAVLGEMRELGSQSDEEHATVGRLAADAHLDLLVVVGSGASPLAGGRARARTVGGDRDTRRRRRARRAARPGRHGRRRAREGQPRRRTRARRARH